MEHKDNIQVLHTQEIKKKYSWVERDIKRCLTELLLLSDIWHKDNICRWLSITKDFKIRELSAEENSKYLSNPSNIKSFTLKNTVDGIKGYLVSLIKSKVLEDDIAERYIEWIEEFFWKFYTKFQNELIENYEQSKNYRKYLKQCKKINNVKKQNVKFEVARILFDKFWDDAFEEKISHKKAKESLVVLSKKSLDYLYVLFCNANEVRDSRWKNLDQVFHDGDFSFITSNVKWTETDYINVLIYLLDKSKINYYWKRGMKWQKEWSRKTSQYADVLRALTNDQLGISKMNLWEQNPDFQRDDTTKKLYMIWWWLLENIVVTRNQDVPWKKMQLNRRLKSLPSCVEKIIEGKKINDTIGFRLSTLWISDQNFDEIKAIMKIRFKMFKASLTEFPEKYVEKWQTIKIKSVTIDNKWVLEPEQLDDMVSELSKIIPASKRVISPSPYISLNQWEEKMEKHYPEIVKDNWKWEILKSFYDKISRWKNRGRNWWYKDFKFNIVFEIDNDQGDSIGEKMMEVQFDDINNGEWLSNYNIRNFERWVNTQSRLSFSIPLSEVRKSCEKNLKLMQLRAKKWNQEVWKTSKKNFFDIVFDDGSVINISSFSRRNNVNSKALDIAIVKIINYFLQKGTFVLCDSWDVEAKDFKLKNKLLTEQDLHDFDMMKNLHICSSLELAAQQHSYLQQWWDRKVWIYLPDRDEIGRISLGELIDPMNLWKKRNPEYSADL